METLAGRGGDAAALAAARRNCAGPTAGRSAPASSRAAGCSPSRATRCSRAGTRPATPRSTRSGWPPAASGRTSCAAAGSTRPRSPARCASRPSTGPGSTPWSYGTRIADVARARLSRADGVEPDLQRLGGSTVRIVPGVLREECLDAAADGRLGTRLHVLAAGAVPSVQGPDAADLHVAAPPMRSPFHATASPCVPCGLLLAAERKPRGHAGRGVARSGGLRRRSRLEMQRQDPQLAMTLRTKGTAGRQPASLRASGREQRGDAALDLLAAAARGSGAERIGRPTTM